MMAAYLSFKLMLQLVGLYAENIQVSKISKAEKEILSILIVAEYRYPFDPADHDVVQCSRSV
ncbi:MAG TPA: hypothetical protein VJ624_06080 [Thermodesulfobacteriota bacterium]|nr:hypothetical protein [Thermodesulfobacteriota bacterium]